MRVFCVLMRVGYRLTDLCCVYKLGMEDFHFSKSYCRFHCHYVVWSMNLNSPLLCPQSQSVKSDLHLNPRLPETGLHSESTSPCCLISTGIAQSILCHSQDQSWWDVLCHHSAMKINCKNSLLLQAEDRSDLQDTPSWVQSTKDQRTRLMESSILPPRCKFSGSFTKI